jgi:hypothetical protein
VAHAENPKPLISAACIVERVLHERDEVLSAMRIVDVYRVKVEKVPQTGPPPPAGAESVRIVQVMNLTGLVMLKAGPATPGAHVVSVKMRRPDNSVLALPEAFSVTFEGTGPTEGANLIFRFLMPHTSPAGQYWFDVSWDGDPLTSIPLRLELPENSEHAEPLENDQSQ